MHSGDTTDIWVAEADGSNPQQLTHGRARTQGSPYWSPDGRRVVFDSFGDDQYWHIWIVDADGGTPRRLTTQAGHENSRRVPTTGGTSIFPPIRARDATSGVHSRAVGF